MNRRTLLTTTSLALVPRLPGRTSANTEEAPSDPPSLTDLLPDADRIQDWPLKMGDSSSVSWRADTPRATVFGSKSRRHPRNDESLSPRYARRRFITDSALPKELEHLEVALEVASIGQDSPYDNRHRAIRALHDITFEDETEDWDLLTTGWVKVIVSPADDRVRQSSVATIRKPLCAIPDDVELSTDEPMFEMAVAVAPLPWGMAVVKGKLVDPDDANQTRQLVTRVASRTKDAVRGRPLPVEARR
jgi:hypothetical protein